MNRFRKHLLVISLMVALAGVTTGCVIRSTHHSSSVVQYLYPDQKQPVEKPAIPTLTLPLRVGVAFVPSADGRHQSLTEEDKMSLMQ